MMMLIWAAYQSIHSESALVEVGTANWSARYGHCMVAANSSYLLVAGGFSATGYMNDVWKSGASPFTVYTQLTVSGGSPPAAHRFAACSIVNSTFVWAGGQLSTALATNNVYTTLNGITWQLQTGAFSARQLHSMTVVRGVLYLAGGVSGIVSNNEVWASSDAGITWSLITQTSVRKWAARNSHASTTFDGRIVIACGRNDATYTEFSDVWWSYDGANWFETGVSGVPSPRFGHTMAAANDFIYIFGGTKSAVTAGLNEFFVSPDTRNWCHPTQTSPFTTARFYMASTSLGTSIFLSGGYLGSTNTFSAVIVQILPAIACTAATTTALWSRLPVPGWNARTGHAVGIIPSTMYIFGGTINNTDAGALSDVWKSTDGANSWTQLVNMPFGARHGMRAVYASGLALFVLAGGRNIAGVTVGDSWTFDGTTWTAGSPASTAALGRSYFGMAIDTSNNIVVECGSDSSNAAVSTAYFSTQAGGYTNWVLTTTTVSTNAFEVQSLFFSGSYRHFGGHTASPNAVFGLPILGRTIAGITTPSPATAWTVNSAAPAYGSRAGYCVAAQASAAGVVMAGGYVPSIGSTFNLTIDVYISGAITTFTINDPLPVSSIVINPVNGQYISGRANGGCVSKANLNGATNSDVFWLGGFDGTSAVNDVFQFVPNLCASFPCTTGQVCTQGSAGGYSCGCPGGYNGVNCTVPINECASNPCFNGGTCNDFEAFYTCSCASGTVGTNCQTNIDECISQPCVNGGTCVDGIGSFSCTCVAGYSGTLCSTDINECASQPCAFGGACVDGLNKYTCNCNAGTTGVRFSRTGPGASSP